MKKNIKIIIVVLVITLVIVSVGGVTYALYGANGNNPSIDLTVKGLNTIIEYKNSGHFEGTLNFGSTYEDGISTNIIFYNKDENTPLKGYIYLDLISLPEGFGNEKAFKWTVIRNSEKCKSINADSYDEDNETIYCKITGNFNENLTGSSITLMGPFDLGISKENFDIYVWVDSSVPIKNTELETEKLQLSVRAYAYQKKEDNKKVLK